MVKDQKMLELLDAYKLEELRDALKENIREELQKTAGTKKSEAALVNNLVKAASKEYNRASFTKAHPFTVSGVSYYGFTEGRYVLASENDFNYDHAVDHELFKMEKFFDGLQNNIFVVDMQELQMFCKDKQNKSNNFQYTLKAPEGFAVAFNAKYMLACLQFAGVDHFYYNAENVRGCVKSPLLIKNENDNKLCLCLPVNCTCSGDACGALEYMEKWRRNEL